MKRNISRFVVCRPASWVVVLWLVIGPEAARACAVCFGKEDTPVTQAANGAILFMLAVLVPVLGSFLGFIVYLARKAAGASALERPPNP